MGPHCRRALAQSPPAGHHIGLSDQAVPCSSDRMGGRKRGAHAAAARGDAVDGPTGQMSADRGLKCQRRSFVASMCLVGGPLHDPRACCLKVAEPLIVICA